MPVILCCHWNLNRVVHLCAGQGELIDGPVELHRNEPDSRKRTRAFRQLVQSYLDKGHRVTVAYKRALLDDKYRNEWLDLQTMHVLKSIYQICRTEGKGHKGLLQALEEINADADRKRINKLLKQKNRFEHEALQLGESAQWFAEGWDRAEAAHERMEDEYFAVVDFANEVDLENNSLHRTNLELHELAEAAGHTVVEFDLELQKSKREYAELQEDVKQTNKRLKTSEDAMTGLLSSNTELEKINQGLSTSLVHAKKRVKDAEKRLEEAKSKLTKVEESHRALELATAGWASEREALLRENGKLKTERDDLSLKLETVTSERDSVKETLEKLRASVKTLQADLASANQTLRLAQEKHAREVEDIQRRLTVLEGK